MKKAVVALGILILLGSICAGYYFFMMQPDQPEDTSEIAESTPVLDLKKNEQKSTVTEPELQKPSEHYVIERRIDVYNHPKETALIIDTLYKGEKVTVLEQKEGWFRLSDYIVYEEGGEETAEWVNSKGLSDAQPVIKEQERLDILDGYLHKSDDLKVHLDMFRNKTQLLLNDETCRPSDFEELGGWVRSVTYKSRNVYFIYCGGLEQENKIYLDVDKGKIFYR